MYRKNGIKITFTAFIIFCSLITAGLSAAASLSGEDYARLYADVSVTIANAGISHAGWKDSFDRTAPAGDDGRGITNWQAHYKHALSKSNRQSVHDYVRMRLQNLQKTIPVHAYAQLYADVSVRIAELGRYKLGWMDGQDPNGPANDTGRGVSSSSAHFNHAIVVSNAAATPPLVAERMRNMLNNILD